MVTFIIKLVVTALITYIIISIYYKHLIDHTREYVISRGDARDDIKKKILLLLQWIILQCILIQVMELLLPLIWILTQHMLLLINHYRSSQYLMHISMFQYFLYIILKKLIKGQKYTHKLKIKEMVLKANQKMTMHPKTFGNCFLTTSKYLRIYFYFQ